MYRVMPLFLAIAILSTAPATALNIVVTTDANIVDFIGAQTAADLLGPDNEVSLHEAIIAANNTVGADTITFDLAPAERAINIVDPLPPITDSNTTIAGMRDAAGRPLIVLTTNPSGPVTTGIQVTGFSTVLRDLWFQFDTGIDIFGGSADNRIEGCVFGAIDDEDISSVGVRIRDGALNNVVGGPSDEQSNAFIMNAAAGIIIEGEFTTNNRIQGNRFGYLDSITGLSRVETGTGVIIRDGAIGNVIGGMAPGEGNLFEECSGHAIEVASAAGNLIIGNQIGFTGSASAGGILAVNTPDLFIGSNEIQGHRGPGIRMQSCDNGRIEDNRIGDLRANRVAGIELIDCTVNMIGGVDLGNIVQDTDGDGIILAGSTSGIRIVANEIRGSKGDGVAILDTASANFVGFMDVTGGNAIENNEGHGVYIASGASGNSVRFNRIYNNEAGNLTLEPGANGGISPPEIDRSFPGIEGFTDSFALVDVYSSDLADPRGALEWVQTVFSSGFFAVPTPIDELGDVVVLAATSEGEATSAFVTVCLVGDCGLGEPDPEQVNPVTGIFAAFACPRDEKTLQTPMTADAALVLFGVPLLLVGIGRRR